MNDLVQLHKVYFFPDTYLKFVNNLKPVLFTENSFLKDTLLIMLLGIEIKLLIRPIYIHTDDVGCPPCPHHLWCHTPLMGHTWFLWLIFCFFHFYSPISKVLRFKFIWYKSRFSMGSITMSAHVLAFPIEVGLHSPRETLIGKPSHEAC